MVYCTKCGKQNPDTSKFCTSCGGGLTVSIPSVFQKKNNRQWVIIGIIVLAGLLVGSYFLFLNKAGNKNSSTSSSKSIVNDDETAKLKELIHEWSASLNRGSAADVSSLYAERLVYYRTQMSKGNAQVLLSDFFIKNPAFNQQITSEITIEKLNDNLIVCNFQKTVTKNGKTTDYPSYLKFSKVEMSNWLIVEEGDKITDYNLNKNK